MAEPRRLYLSADRSKIVEEGDADAGFLLTSNADEYDRSATESQFGKDVADMVDKHVRSKARKSAPEDKAIEGPAEKK